MNWLKEEKRIMKYMKFITDKILKEFKQILELYYVYNYYYKNLPFFFIFPKRENVDSQ